LLLKDEVAVISGAASGIGKAIAMLFAEQGCSVVLLDRDPAVEELAARIAQQSDVKTLACVGDVTDFAAMQAAAKTTLNSLQRCDHVVCAAGAGSGKYGFPFWNLEPADWQRVLQVNLMGTVNVVHAFAPTLIAAQRGTILFLASVAGQIGSQTDPPYSAAKAAVINFGQCAAKDFAAYGVRVNTICPGMIKTPLNRSVWKSWHDQQASADQKSYEEWAAAKINAVVPLQRWQEPEDVADLAVFLASHEHHRANDQL
jgi:2-hydroxycyclohexanecarboxyl-CoA dehydrogenase